MTKIRVQFLEAIEGGSLENLPGEVYSRGFIRTFLEVTGSLDLWPEYELVLSGQVPVREKNAAVQYMPVQKGFQKGSRVWIFSFLLFAAGISLYMIWQQKDAMKAQMAAAPEISRGQEALSPEQIPVSADVTQETVLSDDPAGETDAVAENEPALDTSWIPGHEDKEIKEIVEETPALKGVLVIRANGNCWIRITRDDGKTTQMTLNRGGSTETVVDVKTSVRFGNAGAVTLLWGGKEIRGIGKAGEVVNVDFLPDGTMKRQ
jgi:cytoskeletal protein RodZ